MPFVTSAVAGLGGFPATPFDEGELAAVACGTASNTVIVGWIVGNSGDTNSITGMLVNGSGAGVTADTQLSWGSNDNIRFFWWAGTGPGTVPIGFTYTGDISIVEAGCAVWSGYTGVANITNIIGGTTLANQAISVTNLSGDLAVMLLAHETTANAISGGGATLRRDTAAIFGRYVLAEETTVDPSVDVTASGPVSPIVRYGFSLLASSSGTAPSITDQPDPVTVTEGATANFTVAATGTGTLTYQWQVDTGSGFANVSTGTGGTTASYTTVATTLAMNGYDYRCVVTGDTAPPATSSSANLTVNAAGTAPTVTTDPVTQSVPLGGSVTLTVVASGSTPLTYQWRKDGGNISGAISASYNIPSFALLDEADYDVVVTNAYGSDTSAIATLTLASSLGVIDLSGGEFEFVRKNQTRIQSKNGTFWVYNSAGALVSTILASTNASGVVGLLESASIASNTLYEVEFEFEDGEYGVLYVTSEV